MEQQIITLVNQHIAQLFIEVKNILLHPDSYSQEVETEHLFDYFRFLETALHQPYNRLISTNTFIQDIEGLLSNQMYPISMLKAEAKQAINDKYNKAASFANGLDVGGFDPKNQILCREGHLEKK